MFTAALWYIYTVANTWKQLKCPSIDDGIKKMWYIYIYNEILLSHQKENETPPFVTAWMDLENIMLSKIHQTENIKNHTISLICRI